MSSMGSMWSGARARATWTFNLSTIYDRSGTPRFWGQGNNTPESAETNYTETQGYLQAQLGWNITHYLQLAWMSRPHLVDVTEGTLTDLVPITRRYAGLLGLGTNDEFLNRLLLILDTRNDLTAPSSGAEVVIYGGMSSRRGIFNDSLYSEAGIDARDFIPLTSRTVLALHSALRYLPSYHKLPFWALQLHRRGSERHRRRTAAARLRRGALVGPEFVLDQCRAATDRRLVQCRLDAHRSRARPVRGPWPRVSPSEHQSAHPPARRLWSGLARNRPPLHRRLRRRGLWQRRRRGVHGINYEF